MRTGVGEELQRNGHAAAFATADAVRVLASDLRVGAVLQAQLQDDIFHLR
jgi:hypothetical protein